MSDDSRSPELSEVLDRIRASAVSDVRVAVPARVHRWDATKQQIDAEIVIKGAYEDEDGNRQTELLPIVPNVPVVFPGGGGFRVTFPISVGDSVLLVFSDKSLDKWLAVGGTVDPEDDHTHNLSDAIAIPGLHDFAHPLSTAPATATIDIGRDGGAFQGVGLGADINSFLSTLKSAYNGHTHPDPVSGNTGTPSTTVTATVPAASTTTRVTP